MKRVLPLLLCASLFVLCFSGCAVVNFGFGNTNMVTGEGDLESYEIKVGQFSKIRVDGYCDVNYYAASSDTVTLQIQPNLREYYEVEVVRDELVVRTKRGTSTHAIKTPVLTVSAPVLTAVRIDGVSAFRAQDKIVADSLTITIDGAGSGEAEIEVDRLTAEVDGVGSLSLSGTAANADLRLDGAGRLNALSLQTKDAKVKLNGVGSISVSCSDNLTISADGVGSVEYKGSPSIDLNKSGLATIRKVS
ncbi:MAG: DUF2807 domain-containing protein [Oscillospiraceae bacterium]|jgi:hypothetical protein|nr:DUF2807 domain-containing protein [Oscillospiraceae bacterium]